MENVPRKARSVIKAAARSRSRIPARTDADHRILSPTPRLEPRVMMRLVNILQSVADPGGRRPPPYSSM